jgi:hypothetical protein
LIYFQQQRLADIVTEQLEPVVVQQVAYVVPPTGEEVV